MVATRNHPRDFPPPPTESPTKRTTRSSEATTSSSMQAAPPVIPKPSLVSLESKASPTKSRPSSSLQQTTSRRVAPSWAHNPHPALIPWLAASLPLVIWDTIYIMGRPHTFAGGAIAWPFYKPYELYGKVDPVYSPEAYYSGLGWTGAQGLGNIFETAAYFAYIWIVVKYGRSIGKGEGILGQLGAVGSRRTVEGYWGAVANLVGYTTLMITVAKSVLYWYNDAFMGFPLWKNNTWFNFIFVFAIPNGAWIVVPLYLSYIFALELLEGLTFAAEGEKKVR